MGADSCSVKHQTSNAKTKIGFMFDVSRLK